MLNASDTQKLVTLLRNHSTQLSALETKFKEQFPAERCGVVVNALRALLEVEYYRLDHVESVGEAILAYFFLHIMASHNNTPQETKRSVRIEFYIGLQRLEALLREDSKQFEHAKYKASAATTASKKMTNSIVICVAEALIFISI